MTKESLNALVGLDAWPSGSVFLGLGFLSLAVGVGAIFYLLRRRGKTRAMTQEEITDQLTMRRNYESRGYAVSTGRGVRREASMGIDDLRLAAKRGDWALFWAFPLSFTGLGGALQFIFMAVSVWTHTAVFALVVSLFNGLFCGATWFMAWAAIYTTIDAGTADPLPDGEAEDLGAR